VGGGIPAGAAVPLAAEGGKGAHATDDRHIECKELARKTVIDKRARAREVGKRAVPEFLALLELNILRV
jgi:hypothetical protein